MNRGITGELVWLFAGLLLCLLVGRLVGQPCITLLIGLAAYLLWTLWNQYRLNRWLQNRSPSQAPESFGIWREMISEIIQLQKQQHRERARLQAVIRRGQETTGALRDGIILLNRQRQIEWFNSSAEQLLGLRSQDVGHSLFNYIRHPTFRSYLNNGDFREPLDVPAPHNDAVHLQYQIRHFGQGESLVVVRDITRVHRLEEMRKDFVANLSHELKTPLTVIRGYVETLAMSDEVPPKWQRALQQMEQQTFRMTALIQDLTQLSRLETNENLATHRPVHLKPLLHRIAEDGLALAQESGHTIEVICAEGIGLLGNEKELYSAISNLVVNAIKYSPAGTPISIRVRDNALGLLIAVKDSGPGIESSHLPRLTERFYRVDASRNAGTGGTGLGLAIVKHVMLRHGGHLRIKSKLGRGSTFTCVFPPQKVVSGISAREPKVALTGP